MIMLNKINASTSYIIYVVYITCMVQRGFTVIKKKESIIGLKYCITT